MPDQQLEREEEERYEQIDRVLDKADDDNSDADADEQGEDQRSGPKRERQYAPRHWALRRYVAA